MRKTLTLGAATLFLLVLLTGSRSTTPVNPTTVRDYLTLLASLLIFFCCFGDELKRTLIRRLHQ